jgi:aryl-alcohol dehydrogenase-like predicted oxidoreductase
LHSSDKAGIQNTGDNPEALANGREIAMEYRPLGRTGVKVSPICLGTDNYGFVTSEDEAIRMINRAIDAGINLLDTANVYKSEPIIGKALAENGQRHQVLIATKVHHPVGPGPNERDLSRLHIIRECEKSLRRLGTDYIDLYQVHRCCFHIPVDETLGALTDLVRQGKVRYIGSSTHPAWKIMEAIMVSEMKGYARYISEQSPYNLLARRIENELIPMCQAHGVGVLAWSPLAMGILAGRYTGWDGKAEHYPEGSRAAWDSQGRTKDPAGSRASTEVKVPAGMGIYSERVTPQAVAVGDRFVQLAKEYGISPAQLALLWAKDQEGITAVLAGARTMEQLELILPVLDMDFDRSLQAACDELVPPGTNVANFLNTALWGKQRTQIPWSDGTPRV